MNPVILITGGGSGIGAATAHLTADAGATVVIVGRRLIALERTAEGRPTIHPIALDLAEPGSVQRLLEQVVSAHGRLDGVVANAGTMVTGTVAETTEADWQAALDVNLTGTFLLAKYAIEHLRASRGSFVAVGSIAGIRAPKGAAAYAISKAAIGMLVATIAVEEAGNGVRANCVNPGWVRTEMADAEMDAFGGHIGRSREEAYEAVTALVPQQRPARADEVAKAIGWLLGPDSSYVNGASLTIDGGTSLVDPGTVPFDFSVEPRA